MRVAELADLQDLLAALEDRRRAEGIEKAPARAQAGYRRDTDLILRRDRRQRTRPKNPRTYTAAATH